jgi:hypothetical protein
MIRDSTNSFTQVEKEAIAVTEKYFIKKCGNNPDQAYPMSYMVFIFSDLIENSFEITLDPIPKVSPNHVNVD